MLTITLLTTLLTLATATPLTRRAASISPQDITKIAPETSSCANSPAGPKECRTATQAAPYIAISFTNFGISSFGEQAALVSLMLYETAGFKYSINHYPGVPGQGTRNMQSPDYNLKYAQYLSTVCTNCGISKEAVQKAQSQGPEQVLALVNTDEWSFGSAAWFLATQCDGSIRQGLREGSEAGWESYLSSCVGTAATEERMAIWRKAMALKQW